MTVSELTGIESGMTKEANSEWFKKLTRFGMRPLSSTVTRGLAPRTIADQLPSGVGAVKKVVNHPNIRGAVKDYINWQARGGLPGQALRNPNVSTLVNKATTFGVPGLLRKIQQ